MAFDVPEFILNLDNDDELESGKKLGWYTLLGFSIILHLTTVMLACMYSSDLNSCAR